MILGESLTEYKNFLSRIALWMTRMFGTENDFVKSKLQTSKWIGMPIFGFCCCCDAQFSQNKMPTKWWVVVRYLYKYEVLVQYKYHTVLSLHECTVPYRYFSTCTSTSYFGTSKYMYYSLARSTSRQYILYFYKYSTSTLCTEREKEHFWGKSTSGDRNDKSARL
jgi:hypothetical protein